MEASDAIDRARPLDLRPYCVEVDGLRCGSLTPPIGQVISEIGTIIAPGTCIDALCPRCSVIPHDKERQNIKIGSFTLKMTIKQGQKEPVNQGLFCKKEGENAISKFIIKVDQIKQAPRPPKGCFGKYNRDDHWCSYCDNAKKCAAASARRS